MSERVVSNGRPSSKIEIENGTGYAHEEDYDTALHRARTTGAVSISADLFEKLYLSPQNAVSGSLRKTFGNPTPIGLVGFLLSLSPLSCSLMGWRGASQTGAAGGPDYWFFGGLLMVLGATGEWILGNTFSSVVFFTFGAFWLTFAGTLNPAFAAYAAFAAEGQPISTGQYAPAFNASFGFFQVFMGVVCFVFLIGSIRTNVCFVVIFFTLVLSFCMLSTAYFLLAEDYAGNATKALTFVKAGGALGFVTCMFGWWIFLAIILESVDFPIALPVGDLSRFVRGRSSKLAAQGIHKKGEV